MDAYHSPNIQSDLDAYSNQMGLPLTTVKVDNTAGAPIDPNGPYGWDSEATLDLQMAHATAPYAKLILVEALSNSDTDLLAAVDKASALVVAAGGGEVSMSWGGTEFPTQGNYELHFKTPGVVYFASSGDSAGTSWPCASPNVVCVGGTSLRRDSNSFAILQETAWIDAGGMSPYFPKTLLPRHHRRHSRHPTGRS